MTRLIDEHPLLIPLVGLVCGIVAGLEWAVTLPFWLIVTLFVLLVGGCLFQSRLICLLLVGCFFAGWGVYAIQPVREAIDRPSSIGQSPLAGMVTAEGIIDERPVALARGQRFAVKVERLFFPDGRTVELKGRLLVTIAQGQVDYLTGDRVRVRGTLSQPRQWGLPGEFNYPRYLALRGIDATLWVQDGRQVVLMRSAVNGSWRRLLDKAAMQCNRAIQAAVQDNAAAAVVMALVTGSQAAIPPDLAAAYARAGVSHILSISGFHVAVIATTVAHLLLFVLLRWQWLALRFNIRKSVVMVTLPVMAGYLVFTGAAPATARSVVMLTAVAVALWAERESDVLDSLLLAALVLIVHSPPVLFDLSFQLSFLSLWGIVVLTPLLMTPVESRLSGWRRHLALFTAASLAAVMATALPTLAAFHQASLTGLIANLVVVPLLGYGAVILGAAAVPLVFVALPVAHALFWLAGWLVMLANRFVLWVSAFPVVRSYQVGQLDLVATVVVLAILSFVRSVRLRLLLVGSVVAGGLAMHLWPAPQSAQQLRLTFLSVGQAESILVQFPDQTTMLIDGGGYLKDNGHDFGERYLVPALQTLGIKRIDRLVLTHPHPDHLGGLPAVAEQLPVGEFWHGAVPHSPGDDYNRLKAALQKKGVPIRSLAPGNLQIAMGGCVVTAIVPPADGSSQAPSDEAGNEQSLVFRLDHNQFSALLMADAGFSTEKRLLENGIAPVTLLKVGHHGSRTATSLAFLERVRPRLAIISVGAGNRFGLPAPATVRRLTDHGVRIYRTDQDGTVQVSTDGRGYQVTTWFGSR